MGISRGVGGVRFLGTPVVPFFPFLFGGLLVKKVKIRAALLLGILGILV